MRKSQPMVTVNAAGYHSQIKISDPRIQHLMNGKLLALGLAVAGGTEIHAGRGGIMNAGYADVPYASVIRKHAHPVARRNTAVSLRETGKGIVFFLELGDP